MSEESIKVSLREYMERMLHDLDKRYEMLFANAEKSVAKAEDTMNKRLEGMNEFRDAMKDQASRMATRIDMERIESELNALRRDRANLDGRIAVLAGVVSALVSVLMLIVAQWIIA